MSQDRGYELMATQRELDQRFDSLYKLLDTKFKAQESAVKIAADNLLSKLEEMNQFRHQLEEERAHFATREWTESSTLRLQTWMENKAQELEKQIKSHSELISHPGIAEKVAQVEEALKPVVKDYESRSTTVHFVDQATVKLIALLGAAGILIGLLDKYVF